MTSYADLLTSNDELDPRRAAELAELLVHLSVRAADRDAIAFDLRRIIERTSDEGTAALADWWLLCGLGARAVGPAYRIHEHLEPGLSEPMDRVVAYADKLTDGSAIDHITDVRQLDEALDRLEDALAYSVSDTTKFGGERAAWDDDITVPFWELLEALRSRSVVDDAPDVTDSDLRHVMKKYDIQPGSDRARYLRRRTASLVEAADEAVRLASLVDGDASPAISIDPDTLPAADNPWSRLLHAIVNPLLAGADDTEARAHQLLASATIGSPTPVVRRLARLAEGWLVTTENTEPSLEPYREQRRRLQGRVATLERAGIDVDLVRILLDDDDLDAAEEELRAKEAERQRRDRSRELLRQLDSLVHELEASDLLGDHETAVQVVRAALDDDDLDTAQQALDQLSRTLDFLQEQALQARARALRERLVNLGSPRELVQLLDRVVEAPAIDGRELEALEDRIDQVEVEEAGRVTQAIAAVRAGLTDLGDQVDPADAARINTDLSAAEALQADGRLAAAAERVRAVKASIDGLVVRLWIADQGEETLVAHIVRYLRHSVAFAEQDIRRLHAALKAKRFVVLAGLTGSGKSTIARLYAEAIDATPENGRFVRVAVRPNWIDQSEVLGYLNPLVNRYEPGWLASLIKACNQYPDLPFFCLLDEMNLAPVEHYLADLLSAMEDARSALGRVDVALYSAGASPENADEWPDRLPFPDNLFLVGTVNVDESTRAMSDRVLDRASVLQLSLRLGREHHDLRNPDRVEPRWRVRMRDWKAIMVAEPTDEHHDFLVEIAEALARMGIGIGVRNHLEIERFLANAHGVLEPEDALDLAVLQRIIPKVRGFKRDLIAGLQQLREQLDSVGADRCVAVVDDWLGADTSDDAFLDGTDARVGIITTF